MPPKKNSVLYFKEEGNKHMAQHQPREAVAAYNQALAAMGPASDTAGDAEATKLRTILHANSAQAHIDQYLYDKAEEDATAALACDPTFFKARYRRAVSLLERGGEVKLSRCRDDVLVLCREVKEDVWLELAAALRLQLVTAEMMLATSPPALVKKEFAELTAADVVLMWDHAESQAADLPDQKDTLRSEYIFQDKFQGAHLYDDQMEQQDRAAAAAAAGSSTTIISPEVALLSTKLNIDPAVVESEGWLPLMCMSTTENFLDMIGGIDPLKGRDRIFSSIKSDFGPAFMAVRPNTPSSARRWLHMFSRFNNVEQCPSTGLLTNCFLCRDPHTNKLERLAAARDALIRIATSTQPPLITSSSGAHVWVIAARCLISDIMKRHPTDPMSNIISAGSVLFTPEWHDCLFLRVAPWLDLDVDGALAAKAIGSIATQEGFHFFFSPSMCRAVVRDSVLAMSVVATKFNLSKHNETSELSFEDTLAILECIAIRPGLPLHLRRVYATAPSLVETVVFCLPRACASRTRVESMNVASSVVASLHLIFENCKQDVGDSPVYGCCHSSIAFSATLLEMTRRYLGSPFGADVTTEELELLRHVTGFVRNMAGEKNPVRTSNPHRLNDCLRELLFICARRVAEVPPAKQLENLTAHGDSPLQHIIVALGLSLQAEDSSVLRLLVDLGLHVANVADLSLWIATLAPIQLTMVVSAEGSNNSTAIDAVFARMISLTSRDHGHHLLRTLRDIAVRVPSLPRENPEDGTPDVLWHSACRLFWLATGFVGHFFTPDQNGIATLPRELQELRSSFLCSSEMHDIIAALFEWMLRRGASFLRDFMAEIFAVDSKRQFATTEIWDRVMPALAQRLTQQEMLPLVPILAAWATGDELEEPIRAKVVAFRAALAPIK